MEKFAWSTNGKENEMVLNLSNDALGRLAEIRLALGQEELLGQATEECCELGQACQKVRRAMRGATPVTLAEARDKLNEEAGDVLNYLQVLSDEGLLDLEAAQEIAERKVHRWYARTIWGGNDGQACESIQKRERCVERDGRRLGGPDAKTDRGGAWYHRARNTVGHIADLCRDWIHRPKS